jgi:hypothetical protein
VNRQEAGRLGGKALAAKVDRSYFQFIGRRGGRRTIYHERKAAAERWLCPLCVTGQRCILAERNPAGHQRMTQEIRDYYSGRAEEHNDGPGPQRIMLELWQ